MQCLQICFSGSLKSVMCTGIDYKSIFNQCWIYNVNKYTVPITEYVAYSYSYHCVVDVCPPGHAMNVDKTCYVCPINTLKLYQGTQCQPCKPGYDTNNMTEASKCSKTCGAGYQSLDGFLL